VSRLPGGTRGQLISAAAVVVGLAAVYGAGVVTHPTTVGTAAALAQPSRAAVSSAIRACPSPGSAGTTTSSVATAALAGAAGSGSGSGSGSAVITRLSAAGSAAAGAAVHTVTKPDVLDWSKIAAVKKPSVKRAKSAKQPAALPASNGSSAAVDTVPALGGVVVQAAGAMARGLEVEQTGPGGLVTGRCPAPGTDFWFVGPGPDSAAQIELYLMNTDGQPANVAVSAVTDSGPLLGSSGSDTGIVVPPHGMVIQSLGKFLHSSRVIALHVSTSVGRVAAAVRETKSPADQGGWLPVAQAPAKSLVIPGVPASTGTREVYIAVPGAGNAQIKVTAVTAKGSYQPTGGNGIDLAGDSAVAVEFPSLTGVAAAIKISSSVPVTASVKVPGGASGAPGAISAAAAPISQQGVVAASPAGSAGSAHLVISAPRGAATVRIVAATSKIAFSGQVATLVHVAAGHTVVTRIKPPRGGKTADFSVVVTPVAGSGPVYVARVITSGGAIRSILPVDSALTWVPLPPTQDSLAAAGR
jgi:hypothetical protein